jgi:transcriptional regulator with XRE-family HTH domain
MDEKARKHAASVLRRVLRSLRTAKSFTQSELAERLHQPQSYVSKYESGERRLDLPELLIICRCLGVSLRDLVDQFERSL